MRRGESPPYDFQHLIADMMSKGVVDILEEVDVEQCQGEAFAGGDPGVEFPQKAKPVR